MPGLRCSSPRPLNHSGFVTSPIIWRVAGYVQTYPSSEKDGVQEGNPAWRRDSEFGKRPPISPVMIRLAVPTNLWVRLAAVSAPPHGAHPWE